MSYIKAAFFIILLFTVSCAPPEEDEQNKVIYSGCSESMENKNLCTRFMDRDIYFAFPEGTRNNSFDVQSTKEAIQEISTNTFFGSNYFRFQTVDESILETPEGIEDSEEDFKSYIQILDDVEFNNLYNNTGPHADPNAILFVNFANKKKFSVILRASCFSVSDFDCTNDASVSFTPNSGLRALVGRTLMRMFAVNIKSCVNFPNDVMCANFPSDTQWNNFNRDVFFNDMKNAQSAVANDPNYYEF
jgi:hypothetical protein